MKDLQKAIKHFECVRDGAMVVLDSGFGTKPNESNTVYKNRKLYAELAISALKNQIPKKLRVDEYGWYKCPNCGETFNLFNEFKKRNKCCGKCGQTIDWSEYIAVKGISKRDKHKIHIGDVLYENNKSYHKTFEWEVIDIWLEDYIGGNKTIVKCSNGNWTKEFFVSDILAMYKTREEAEAKLKEGVQK